MAAELVDSREYVRRVVVQALRDPAGALQLPPGELDLTLRVMRRARLLGHMAVALRARGLLTDMDSIVADQFLSALEVAKARARVARWEMDRITRALQSLPDVPIVALKGCGYLLADTPNAEGRAFADVDLLVPETNLESVEALLRQAGWQSAEITSYDERYYRTWAHEIPPLRHPEREVEVDLHHAILMRTARLKPSTDLLLASARPVPGSRFRVLAPADMVLHAIAHLFYGGEMDDALRELVDIDVLLHHFTKTEPAFWKYFWRRAQELDLERPAFYGLRFAQRLLGTPVPAAVVAESKTTKPTLPVLGLMDQLVPRALFPRHPDHSGRGIEPARLLLYLRSHWVKMPAPMLIRHLLYKSYIRKSHG
jgi:hypothetical protein